MDKSDLILAYLKPRARIVRDKETARHVLQLDTMRGITYEAYMADGAELVVAMLSHELMMAADIHQARIALGSIEAEMFIFGEIKNDF